MTIIVENLTFSYGRMSVLRGVHARAERGKITALLGPNAAGKSTLLKCIIGLLHPQRGGAMIDGHPVHRLRPRETAQRIAYVPQRSIVSAAFTVRQIVELGRYAMPPAPEVVEAAIVELDLAAVADRPYPKLSVGQQQRVTLARALAQLGGTHSSKAIRVFVLDEPTSAMDLEHVSSTIQLLRALADRGAMIVLAMHDLSLAAAIADDVWLLQNGEMVASGVACDVLDLERLRQVFRTDFQWLQAPDGKPRLFADVRVSNAAQIA